MPDWLFYADPHNAVADCTVYIMYTWLFYGLQHFLNNHDVSIVTDADGVRWRLFCFGRKVNAILHAFIHVVCQVAHYTNGLPYHNTVRAISTGYFLSDTVIVLQTWGMTWMSFMVLYHHAMGVYLFHHDPQSAMAQLGNLGTTVAEIENIASVHSWFVDKNPEVYVWLYHLVPYTTFKRISTTLNKAAMVVMRIGVWNGIAVAGWLIPAAQHQPDHCAMYWLMMILHGFGLYWTYEVLNNRL